MAEAEIFRAIREQREAINRSELKLLREMARLWVPTYRYLEEQLQQIVDTIEEKQANGEPIDMSWIYSLDRYQSMLGQSREAIDKYNKAAAQQISGAEADAVDIGVSNARQLVNAAEPDDPLWTRINQRETRIMAGQLSETSPLHTLLSRNWGETMSGIEKALTIGISTGQGSDWVARQMVEAANIPLKRALTIARTEVNRAYREATLETMRSSRAVIGYRRMCYPPTACFACLMMDGEFYDKASSFSDHPNGKCAAVPVTRHYDPINDDSWERGQDWFARQSEETQRKIMGPGRYDLWKNEGVNPRDMVYIKENPFWGGSPTVKTLESIIRSQSIPLSLQNRNSLDISEDVKNEIIENGRKALIFFQHVDPLYEYAKTIPPLSGYQDIFVHGGDTGFMFKDVGYRHNQETYINVNEFADFVKESQVYKGGKIRLISCGTGGETAMTAQWFADAMGVEVLAPTKEANLWKNYLEIFDKDGNPGEWKTFVPRKGTQH